jgi:hypothetical protein
MQKDGESKLMGKAEIGTKNEKGDWDKLWRNRRQKIRKAEEAL